METRCWSWRLSLSQARKHKHVSSIHREAFRPLDDEKGENMAQEYIEIHGARENNLRNVSLRIPKRKITIFTGVSGSGKSSIVFDTIATEAQRQLYETL